MNDIFNASGIADEPKMKVITLTPDLARTWLQRNLGNRPIKKSNVVAISEQIKKGRWKMTGDAIRFSNTGKLIDGQHRLSAIVEAGIPVQTLVITGLADEIFDVIDTGSGRSKSDVVFIDFALTPAVAKLVSSSAGMAMQYEAGVYSFKGKVGNHELLTWVRNNTEIISASEYVIANVPHESPAPKSVACAFYFFAGKLDQDKAGRFLERFMVGAVDGPEDNLLHLRNFLMNARALRRPVQNSDIFGRMIKIWNAERKNKPIKHFNNTIVRSEQDFPKFI
jgi:hypothetical protein